MLENIATLIAPPASSFTETEWLSQVTSAADAPLLLDLHNLYVNTLNFGVDSTTDPIQVLRTLPLARVGTVHIAGGQWISAGRGQAEQRLLDDHLHPVPDAVFSMVEELAALAPQPLTVVLERDGAYPPMGDLLLELQLARSAMRRGRERKSEASFQGAVPVRSGGAQPCSTDLEALLARIYVDESFRASFLDSPEGFVRRHVRNAEDAAAVSSMDRTGLVMAARSFARKRALKQQHKP